MIEPIVQAIALGVVQGLSEFLPVSSSAHLVLLPALLAWTQPTLTFDAVLHGGTAAAAIWYYRHHWVQSLGATLRALGQHRAVAETQWLGLVVVATLPAVVVGILGERLFEKLFVTPTIAAFMLLLTGTVLALADRRAKRTPDSAPLGMAIAIGVGLAQALAIVPGLSRSGMTIAAGIFLGLSREQATQFSFLLAGPITLGAFAHQLLQTSQHPGAGLESPLALAIAFVTTAVAGYLAMDGLLRLARRSSFALFAIYCWLFGLFSLWWLH